VSVLNSSHRHRVGVPDSRAWRVLAEDLGTYVDERAHNGDNPGRAWPARERPKEDIACRDGARAIRTAATEGQTRRASITAPDSPEHGRSRRRERWPGADQCDAGAEDGRSRSGVQWTRQAESRPGRAYLRRADAALFERSFQGEEVTRERPVLTGTALPGLHRERAQGYWRGGRCRLRRTAMEGWGRTRNHQ
jgi:hypothetical protein